MHIYLPIAELSASAPWLVLLGGIGGVFAGLFGLGGGFILTPMLMFMGIPSSVAVATSTNMIVASAFSGFLSHHKRKQVDVEVGLWLVLGGLVGVVIGIWWFAELKKLGQIDLMISLLYITLLSTIGVLMAREFRAMLASHKRGEAEHQMKPLPLPQWVKQLPFRHEFTQSRVTHSLLLPVAIGVLSGLLVALLGIGGGFLMIPAMVYILRMPTRLTVGTSLFQTIFITAFSTLMHAITTHTVDIVLACLLLMGSVIGAQWGARLAAKMPMHVQRALMAVTLLAIALRLAYGLFVTPEEIFSLVVR